MLYYCDSPPANFGDDLNPWLWPRLAPEICGAQDATLFLGIGTILTHNVPSQPLKVVFGSGCWGTGPLPKIDHRWKIHCVRGPLTATRLRLDRSLALADPAILVRRFASRSPRSEYPVSVMPHVQSMLHADWEALCARIGFHCIDPRAGVDRVLDELGKTKLLLAEAMHGAIVADALRVPWIPVRIYSRFNHFKWQDWAQSLGLTLRIPEVSPIYARPPRPWKRLDYAVKKGLARAGLGRESWKRLGIRSSTDSEIARSLEELRQLPERQEAALSNEAVLSRIETRLLEKLSVVRATWIKPPPTTLFPAAAN